MATYQYQYDPTGVDPANLIPNEEYTLSPTGGDNFNFLVVRNGPLFSAGVVIVHTGTGRVLVPGVDFALTHQFTSASTALTKDVFGSITILDRSLVGTLAITYQTLGGQFTYDEANLLTTLASLLSFPDTRTWEDIIAIPRYFPAIQHEIYADDLIGMGEVHLALQEIRDAIMGIAIANNHQHEISGINALQQRLDERVSLQRNHKLAVCESMPIVTFTGAVGIILPKFIAATRVVVNVTVHGPVEPSYFMFSGKVAGGENGLPETNWMSPQTLYSGKDITRECRLSYNNDRFPVIYLGNGMVWDDHHITVTSVTIDSSIPANYIDGWGLFTSTFVYGVATPIETIQGIDDINASITSFINEVVRLDGRIDTTDGLLTSESARLDTRIDNVVAGVNVDTTVIENDLADLTIVVGNNDTAVNTRIDNLNTQMVSEVAAVKVTADYAKARADETRQLLDSGVYKRKFELDETQSGIILPWTIWLIDSSTVRTRSIPDAVGGDEIIVRDASGNCGTNTTSLTGNLMGVNQIDVTTDWAWFRAKFNSVSGQWVIVEGDA